MSDETERATLIATLVLAGCEPLRSKYGQELRCLIQYKDRVWVRGPDAVSCQWRSLWDGPVVSFEYQPWSEFDTEYLQAFSKQVAYRGR